MKNNSNITLNEGELQNFCNHIEDEELAYQFAQRITQILENERIVERLYESIKFFETMIEGKIATDKEQYIWEWIRYHIISIKNNENRNELKQGSQIQ